MIGDMTEFYSNGTIRAITPY